VNHSATWSQYARTSGKERLVVAKMFHRRPRDDQVDRAIGEWERRIRSIRDNLAVDVGIELKLMGGLVYPDDQMRALVFNKGEKVAFPAGSNIEQDLIGLALEQISDFVFVQGKQMSRELGWQARFNGPTHGSVRLDETRK
jgi:hypothetical protein